MKKKPAVPNFIEEERAKGTADEEIQRKLLDAGWHIDIIKSAMGPGQERESSRAVTQPVKSPDYQETLKNPFFIGAMLLLLVLLALFI